MADLFKTLEQATAGHTTPATELLAALKFNDAGLIPAIAQDQTSGEVLMLAWMNRDALEATLASNRVTYFSRSRNELWRKGDTSGHIQTLKKIQVDCDGDTLLLQVEQVGGACHTNRPHCFYTEINAKPSAEVPAGADLENRSAVVTSSAP